MIFHRITKLVVAEEDSNSLLFIKKSPIVCSRGFFVDGIYSTRFEPLGKTFLGSQLVVFLQYYFRLKLQPWLPEQIYFNLLIIIN